MSVAIDCEMVGIGNQNLLVKVLTVDCHGRVLYDEYVKPTATVTDYRTFVSGITKDHLDSEKEFSQVQKEVCNLLNGKILVGHSLHFDLDALGLSHPEANRRDLAKYGPFMKNGQPVVQSIKPKTPNQLVTRQNFEGLFRKVK